MTANILLIIYILSIIAIVFAIFKKYEVKLKRYFFAPSLFIFITIISTILGVIIWLIYTNRVFSDLVLFLTLVVVFVYTYYTFRMLKATYSSQALLYVQTEHSKVLKDFLQKWLKIINIEPNVEKRKITLWPQQHHLDKLEYMYRSGFDFSNIDNLKKLDMNENELIICIYIYRCLEEKWEYNDLLDNHLPRNYSQMKRDWENFRNLISVLRLKGDALYKLIDEDINNKLTQKHPNIKLGLAINNFIYHVYWSSIEAELDSYPEHSYSVPAIIIRNFPIFKNELPNGNFSISMDSASHENILTNISKEQVGEVMHELEEIQQLGTPNSRDLVEEIAKYVGEMEQKKKWLKIKN